MMMLSLPALYFLNQEASSAHCNQARGSLWNYTLLFFFFFSVIFCTHFLIFLPNSVAGASTMKAGEARSVKRGDASLLGQLM